MPPLLSLNWHQASLSLAPTPTIMLSTACLMTTHHCQAAQRGPHSFPCQLFGAPNTHSTTHHSAQHLSTATAPPPLPMTNHLSLSIMPHSPSPPDACPIRLLLSLSLSLLLH